MGYMAQGGHELALGQKLGASSRHGGMGPVAWGECVLPQRQARRRHCSTRNMHLSTDYGHIHASTDWVAVKKAARIEALCRSLDQRVAASGSTRGAA
jgi:hypothetical protein